MVGRCISSSFLALLLLAGCEAEKPVEPVKPEPAMIIRPKQPVLTPEQRVELGFPDDLIGKVQLSAGAEPEPFFVSLVVPTQNLKGEQAFEQEKLAGFSVRTRKADEIIRSYRSGLRVRGFLIFKSHLGYGSLPDIVTVVKGNNSYDILKLQGTEAASYGIDTKEIISWLKEQQAIGSFVITGAGADWLEATFIKQPADMLEFAKKAARFAPDVLLHGPQTVEKLADRMKKNNGFYLVWD